jgi:hypothetical protein
MYAIKYSSHLQVCPPKQRTSISVVLGVLKDAQRCKLAEKTKKELPSPERIYTTFKNINWLLQYWMCKDPLPSSDQEEHGAWDYSICFPDPLSQEYGFSLLSNGKVEWLDLA